MLSSVDYLDCYILQGTKSKSRENLFHCRRPSPARCAAALLILRSAELLLKVLAQPIHYINATVPVALSQGQMDLGKTTERSFHGSQEPAHLLRCSGAL